MAGVRGVPGECGMSGVRGVQRVLMMIAVPRKCKMTEVRGRSFKDGYQELEDFEEGYQG